MRCRQSSWRLIWSSVLLAGLLVSCDDPERSGGEHDSIDTSASIDGLETDGGELDEVSESDFAPPACESLVVPGEVVRAQEEACSPGERCERGTQCLAEKCRSSPGCAEGNLHEYDGCVVYDQTRSKYSTPECECDDACTDSPYGPYCVMKVCQPYPPCDDENPCSAGSTCYPTGDPLFCPDPDVCYEERLCLPDLPDE